MVINCTAGMTQHTNQLADLLECEVIENRQLHLNTVKMQTYLLTQMMEEFEIIVKTPLAVVSAKVAVLTIRFTLILPTLELILLDIKGKEKGESQRNAPWWPELGA